MKFGCKFKYFSKDWKSNTIKTSKTEASMLIKYENCIYCNHENKKMNEN